MLNSGDSKQLLIALLFSTKKAAGRRNQSAEGNNRMGMGQFSPSPVIETNQFFTQPAPFSSCRPVAEDIGKKGSGGRSLQPFWILDFGFWTLEASRSDGFSLRTAASSA
jgi:hypothetical protein